MLRNSSITLACQQFEYRCRIREGSVQRENKVAH